MRLSGVKIGFGLTGSHCTIEEVLPEMEKLKKEAGSFPSSPAVAGTDTRFNRARRFWLKSGPWRENPWLQLTEVEPICPEKT